jgi:hypothetical protein
MMPLLSAEMIARLPALYSQEDNPDPTVQVMLHGANGWTWALTEYSDPAPDGVPQLAFGKVYGDFPELGYVSIQELDDVNLRFVEGLGCIWVDPLFVPKPLSEVDAEADGLQDKLREDLLNGKRVVARLHTITV